MTDCASSMPPLTKSQKRQYILMGGVLVAAMVMLFFYEQMDTVLLALIGAAIVALSAGVAYFSSLKKVLVGCKKTPPQPYLQQVAGAQKVSVNNPFVSSSSTDLHANTQVAHAVFDRLQYALPEYVSMVPSVIAGLVVAGLIGYVGMDHAMQEKAAAAQQTDGAANKRWMLIALGTLVVSFLSFERVQERVYTIMLLKRCKNQQHFAVAQFLKVYRDALR